MNLVEELKKEKLIAILRGLTGDPLRRTVQALIEGGIRFIEITMNTTDAARSIAWLRENHPASIHFGAGTVINVALAKEAIRAGASYLITPNVNQEVIQYAKRQKVDIWPGALTPTEVASAYEWGADAIKVFPASFFGPSYIEALKGPLDHIPFIAVGGVKVDQFQAYLKAGVIAIGVGNQLIDPSIIQAGRFDQLTKRAKFFVQQVKEGED